MYSLSSNVLLPHSHNLCTNKEKEDYERGLVDIKVCVCVKNWDVKEHAVGTLVYHQTVLCKVLSIPFPTHIFPNHTATTGPDELSDTPPISLSASVCC